MTEAEYKRRHAAAGNGLDPGVQVPPAYPKLIAEILNGELIEVSRDMQGAPPGLPDPEWWSVWWKPDVPGGRFIDYLWQRTSEGASIPIRGDVGWYYVVGTDDEGKYVTAKSNVMLIQFPRDWPDSRFFS